MSKLNRDKIRAIVAKSQVNVSLPNSDVLALCDRIEAQDKETSPWIAATPETMPELNTDLLCDTGTIIFRGSFGFVCGIGKPAFRSHETGHITKFPYDSIKRYMPIPPLPER